MKQPVKIQKNSVVRFFLIFFAGAVSSLIFPPFSSAIQGYCAFILFLAYLFKDERSAKSMFWLAYLFGFSFYAVGFAWINKALMIDGGEFSSYVPVVFFVIGAFFSLFFSIPVVLSAKCKNVYKKMLSFTAFFVLFEWIRSFIFTGFPWNLLGTALGFDDKLVQGASVIGTYGLSLMLMLLLNGVALLVISLWQKRFYVGALGFIAVPVAFFVCCLGLYKEIDYNGDIKVRLVQPNIPQTLKWDSELMYSNFRKYIDLSKAEGFDDVDLVVWGETASPYQLDEDMMRLGEVVEAIPNDGFLLTGLLRRTIENGKFVPYNSLFVINSQGVIKDYYDKAHLVPFGEYLPFREYLPDFMEPVANVVGDIGKGEKYKNINVEGLPLMAGAICYESIFPKEVLNPTNRPEVLVVLANDGWYGISSGPYQHLVAAKMRAVEEGVTVIRSANTGISAVIAPNGKILADIGLDKEGTVDVYLPNVLSFDTVYGRYGNIIPLLLAVVLLIFSYLLDVVKGYVNKRF